MRPNSLFKFKKNDNKGMTLIEVLVALFILSTGILGAVAMQASAKKGSFDAMQRSLASSLAQDIIERMRGNNANTLEEYEGNNYGEGEEEDLSVPADCSELTSNCTSDQLIATDLYEWELSLMGANVKNSSAKNGGLLGVTGCISHTNNTVLVAISWEGREGARDGADNAGENATFGKNCGTSLYRRQILVNAFIN